MSNRKLAGIVVGCTAVIIVAIVLIIFKPWEGPASPITEQLKAPANVLSLWESTPSPQGYPPILVGEVTLAEYGKGSSGWETDPFYLQGGQWIDVVVKSRDGVIVLDSYPGSASLKVCFRHSENHGSYWPDREDLGLYNGLNPFLGRVLYQQSTETDTGTIHAVAVRLFSEGEYEDGYWSGCDCTLLFENFNPYKSTSISYEVYELGATPGWGKFNDESYARTVLMPWIYEHTTSALGQEQMCQEWVGLFVKLCGNSYGMVQTPGAFSSSRHRRSSGHKIRVLAS